ncbi:MAG TPA: transglycosylase domain-containing protein [Candidatus Limnocylindrales bacterium]|nr:transglycosylase domain-containing protein [Candidatus Limnocylindrales bacterium]
MPRKKKNHENVFSVKPFFKKILYACFFGIVITLFVFLLLAGVTNAYFYSTIKDRDSLINSRNSGILLLDNKGDPFFAFYNSKRKKYVALSQISRHVERALIISEDRDFYRHGGVSIRGIIRAMGLDFKDKSFSYGGSTITQQLVKNVLLTPEKSLVRKYQEAVLAGQIEARYSKEEIMEMYLNSIYFGEGSFGIEDASQTYFGKNAKDLSIAQASFLVSVIPSPSRLSPYNGNRQQAYKIQKIILASMKDENVITEEEYANAIDEELIFKNNNEDTNNIAPHFALMVRDELFKKYGEEKIVRSGFTVKTTLDTAFQEYAEVSVKNQVEKLGVNKVTNGAAVIMDPKSGEIKSLVGSADWADEKNGKINMAITPRQPGSSFKPFIYASALEEKYISPATVLKDEKTSFKDPNCPSCTEYVPRNYDGEFHGNVLVRRALANSLNIPAVLVMQKVGIPKALAKTNELGISTLSKNPTDYGLSLVLGAGEFPLVEMVQAYSSFANKGELSNYKLYTEIKDKMGETIFVSEDTKKRVWSENVAFLISSILSDNQARAEEFGNALNITRTAAVKTGTTDSYKDAWTIGYTPDLVVGVWVGNNDNTPMDQVAGSLGAAPIWRDLMEKFSEGKPNKDFEKPSGIIQLLICRSNGLKAKNASTSATYTEYFIPGTELSKECTEEIKPTDAPKEKDDQEKKIQEILDRIQSDQQGLLEEIQRRREERRGRFKKN